MKYMPKVIEPTPWSFTIEFDENKAKRNGYDIETLYDYTDQEPLSVRMYPHRSRDLEGD